MKVPNQAKYANAVRSYTESVQYIFGMLRITRLQGLRCTCIDVDGDGLIDHGDIARLHVLKEVLLASFHLTSMQPRATALQPAHPPLAFLTRSCCSSRDDRRWAVAPIAHLTRPVLLKVPPRRADRPCSALSAEV